MAGHPSDRGGPPGGLAGIGALLSRLPEGSALLEELERDQRTYVLDALRPYMRTSDVPIAKP